MKKQALFLALTAAVCAGSAHAVKINDAAFVSKGGNLADINGTAPAAFDMLRTASLSSQFLPVGRIGNCTGTWLGSEGDYAWVLTAARCVPNTHLVDAAEDLVFTNHAGVALAGGAGSTSYVHPNRLTRPSGVTATGTDIAMVRLKRLPASNTQAPAAPVLYDGTAESTKPVSFVAYGSAFAANRQVNAVWPTTGERRAWGDSIIDGTNNAGHALFANFSAGSATRWAGVDPTDAGSAWWQERDGQWQIVATTSGGSTLQSHGTRVSKYAKWINDLFPGARLSSEAAPPTFDAPEVTNDKTFQSANEGWRIGFVNAPDQPLVNMPSGMTHADIYGETWFRTPLVNDAGEQRFVTLRATRLNGCGSERSMNNAIGCVADAVSILRVRYVAANNPDLPVGTWRGRIAIDGRFYNDKSFRKRFDIDIAVNGSAPRVHALHFDSIAPADAYFTVPTQSAVVGPTVGTNVSATGDSLITVNARNAITQAVVPVKLRANRNNSCNDVAMNNAVVCANQTASTLKIRFDASDNPGLPAGRYVAQFNVQARAWRNKTFNTTIPVKVDVNLLP